MMTQTNRARSIASDDSVPRLPRHVRLEFEPVRRRWVVHAPEKVIWPDDVSVDILKLCDGSRSIREIVDELAQMYAGDRETISGDVMEFIQGWSDSLLLRL